MIIPTRDRPGVLRATLSRLAELDSATLGSCELIVVDNASCEPIVLPDRLANGIAVRGIRLSENHHTGARNIGAREARGDWLVMLDDDSSVLPCDLDGVLGGTPVDVGAVGGEIMLGNGQRESGGLPEVVVGCGCAIRRSAFLEVCGYDASFGYYAEEYDLCAKLIAAGQRVVHTRSIRFEHRKSTAGRDFNEIVFRLVRNNAWLIQRYAPERCRDDAIEFMLERYQAIAELENAAAGYRRGIEAIERTLACQTHNPLDDRLWDRFTGRAAVRATLQAAIGRDVSRVRLVGPSNAKGHEVVVAQLAELGCEIGSEEALPAVVSTLSPGPMLDALDANPGAIAPWFLARVGSTEAPLHTIC